MKNLRKYYTLSGKPADVYNALVNPLMLEIWTGEPAVMEETENTEFSLWDGSITGLNLEFEKNKKIVQQWYFEGQQEKSIVTIKLHEHKKGTSMELSHSNIPDEAYQNIVEGWDDDYVGALSELFS